MSENATQRLIEGALAIHWEAISNASRVAAKTFLHDTLAVGVAGRNEPLADIVSAQAQKWSCGDGSSFLLGRSGVRLAAPYAAFVNAYQIHCQEFDCVHEPAVAHPMASVASVLLAEAGEAPVDGRQFLAALIAGVEVVASLGVAVNGSLKFFRPATAGIFGAVIAVSHMRQLKYNVVRQAFGHALSFCSGTMQAHVEGKPTLALQVAGAARSAIEAVDLAVAGFPAPSNSLEGPFGYFSLFENDADLNATLKIQEGYHRIQEVSWKPFPTGRAAHGAIVALQNMVESENLTTESLDRFVYRAPPLIERLVGRRPFSGMSVSYARLCFAWLGANVLHKGGVSLSDFTRSNLDDPKLLNLSEKIFVESDGTTDWSAFAPAVGIAKLTNGRRIEVRVDKQFGAPEWPLSRKQHLEKVRSCLSYGGIDEADLKLTHFIEKIELISDVHQELVSVLEN
ncbi:MmgE/PrpD family protein [Hirschia baltica]|uniref:MmgE/PrpD family protein n=1 Tax=Hirschia baltica (strain ATCC 49814 / DSM 5838 / IFAM 1418) TaxID=582402 RepID=C6XJ87_HIRBI|nr:MmgE/PrpD family protein [Hirschia baltica]ACT59182.1 MmgE/PrpD family protein [Hirschia baltica ATCC 49814]